MCIFSLLATLLSPFATILHLSPPILILLHCPRFLISTTLFHSYHAFSLVARFVSFTDHAFSLLPRFLTRTTLSHSYHAFSLSPRFLSRTTLCLSHHGLCLLLTTLCLSYHAFSLLPRFLTFSLPQCLLTLTTLSHFLKYACHAFSLSHPRFFLADHSPQFSAPTTTFIFYHGFYLAYLSSPFSAAATTFIFHHSVSLQVFPHVQLRYQR